MEKDYVNFMDKVFQRGHATPITCKSSDLPEKVKQIRERFGTYRILECITQENQNVFASFSTRWLSSKEYL